MQAIEKNLHIMRDRDGIRCVDRHGRNLSNECPHRKPRAPLNPPRNAKYCHICWKHGHDMDKCWFNARVSQPGQGQGYPQPTPHGPYPPPGPSSQPKSYPPRPIAQGPTPTLVLPPQQPTYMQNYHPLIRYPNQPRNPVVPVSQIEYDPNLVKDGEVTDDYVEGMNGELDDPRSFHTPMWRLWPWACYGRLST